MGRKCTAGHSLSPREEEVLILGARGLTDKEISNRLSLSRETVVTHWDRIRAKLGAANRTQAVAEALERKSLAQTEQAQQEIGRLLFEITQRERAEQALRESEERYRLISELISDYAYALEVLPDGLTRDLWVTEAFERVTGYARDELPAVPGIIDRFVIDEDRAIAGEWRKRVLGGEKQSCELRIRRKDGEIRWIRDCAMPITDPVTGKVVKVYGAGTDITERKQYEEALRELNQKLEQCVEDRTKELAQAYRRLRETHSTYQNLVDTVDGIVWEGDPDSFCFTFVSKRAERLLGYPLSAWTEDPQFWENHLHPDDRGFAIKYCREATKQRREHTFEYRMIAADGREVWLRDIVTVNVQEDGQVRLRGIMVDITEAKRLEKWEQAQKAVLQLIVANASLSRILDSIVLAVQDYCPNMRCAVLLASDDQEHFTVAAAPSLPPEYRRTIEKKVLPSCDSSCGAAAMTGNRVIISKFPPGSICPELQELADRLGIQSCWAEPIRTDPERVAGTFAIYYNEGRAPQPHEIDLLEGASHIAGLAVAKARADRLMKQIHEDLRRAKKLANVGSWVMTLPDGPNSLFWCDVTCEIFGVAPSQFTGDPDEFYRRVHPDDWVYVRGTLDGAITSLKPFRMRHRIVRPSGEVRWVECSGEVQADETGNPVRAVGAVHDITERVLALEDLQLSEERFRQIADLAPVMIWGTGPDKLCNYCNQKWLDFKGRSMEEEVGEGWVEGVHPDDLDYCRQTFIAAFDAREPFQVEYRLRRFDGDYRTVLDVGKPVYGPDGVFHGYVGYCFDVKDMSRVWGKLSEEAKPA